MNIDYQTMIKWVEGNLPEILEEIRQIVTSESPSRDKAHLDLLACELAEQFLSIGGEVERVENSSGGDHLRIRFNKVGTSKYVLLLGHFDTVWPLRTLDDMPTRVVDNRMTGPGIFDMKTSLVMIRWALMAIQNLGVTPKLDIQILLTSDEEIGSPTSRSWIESAARDASYVLVVEPPLPGGVLKTQRKGVGQFRVDVAGKSAHAGIEPEKGASAIVELAHQILAIQSLQRPELGTTLNVGKIEGGTSPNVVPNSAWAVVDVRVSQLAESERIETAFRTLESKTPGTQVHPSGTFRRPPMERTSQSIALFEQARSIGEKLGMDLKEGATGGASDGNFTAALGIPTLDGLGCPGGGAHAIDEHILVDQLPARIALIAALILELDPSGADQHV